MNVAQIFEDKLYETLKVNNTIIKFLLLHDAHDWNIENNWSDWYRNFLHLRVINISRDSSESNILQICDVQFIFSKDTIHWDFVFAPLNKSENYYFLELWKNPS